MMCVSAALLLDHKRSRWAHGGFVNTIGEVKVWFHASDPSVCHEETHRESILIQGEMTANLTFGTAVK